MPPSAIGEQYDVYEDIGSYHYPPVQEVDDEAEPF